jgi:hypothetical protein
MGCLPVGDNISDMLLRRLLRPVDGVFGHWMKVDQLYHESNPFYGPAAPEGAMLLLEAAADQGIANAHQLLAEMRERAE